MTDFAMPKMDHMTEENTVVEWRRQVGDTIAAGDVLLTVETAKCTLDVECSVAGVVCEILAQPGDVVPVHTVIARIEEG